MGYEEFDWVKKNSLMYKYFISWYVLICFDFLLPYKISKNNGVTKVKQSQELVKVITIKIAIYKRWMTLFPDATIGTVCQTYQKYNVYTQ